MDATTLIVEPNDDIRKLMSLQLRKEKHTVIALKEAKIAILWLQNSPQRVNNLIVSREMLGMSVANLIKVAKTREIWVIVTTTSPFQEETIRELREIGADTVLWKPYTGEQLYRALIGLSP